MKINETERALLKITSILVVNKFIRHHRKKSNYYFFFF